MDCIREAESLLRHYKDFEKSLKWQYKEINKLVNLRAPQNITAINYDGMPKGGVSKETLNALFELIMYEKMSQETKEKIDEIDEVLRSLNDEPGCENYESILRMWYIEKLSKEEIAEKLNYSSRTSIYELRERAIKKFAIRIFGLHAHR